MGDVAARDLDSERGARRVTGVRDVAARCVVVLLFGSRDDGRGDWRRWWLGRSRFADVIQAGGVGYGLIGADGRHTRREHKSDRDA